MNDDETIFGSLWPDVYADLARWIVELEQEDQDDDRDV